MKKISQSIDSLKNSQQSFYQGLEQKYINHKNKVSSSVTSVILVNPMLCSFGAVNRTNRKEQQSIPKTRTNSRVQSCSSGKKLTTSKKQKDKQKDSKRILVLMKDFKQEERNQIADQYHITRVLGQINQIGEYIRQQICQNSIKYLSILVKPLSIQPVHLKSSHLFTHVDSILRIFKKSSLSIYALGFPSCHYLEYYDMLSIRKEIKRQIKLLVQTNICNNSKSSVILKKLIDVAVERQKAMLQTMQIGAIVIRVKALFEEEQNQNMSKNEQNNSKEKGWQKQIQLQISIGNYGELGLKDMTIAQKMRRFVTIMDPQQNLFSILHQNLISYKKKLRAVHETQLIAKIKNLQQELIIKKRQLEDKKKQFQYEEAIQAELQDIVLPSERPMINIKKYTTNISKCTIKYGKNADR